MIAQILVCTRLSFLSVPFKIRSKSLTHVDQGAAKQSMKVCMEFLDLKCWQQILKICRVESPGPHIIIIIVIINANRFHRKFCGFWKTGWLGRLIHSWASWSPVVFPWLKCLTCSLQVSATGNIAARHHVVFDWFYNILQAFLGNLFLWQSIGA